MTLQPKKKRNLPLMQVRAIALGFVLAIACQFVPEQYQAACNAVAKLTAASCGG